MKLLTDDIIHFLQRQGYLIVSTVDENSCPHNSCKGLVHIDAEGTIYLLDLFKARTYINLEHNPHISITAVDEHKFKGYCLKGVASLVPASKIKSGIIRAWEQKIAKRLTSRLLKELRQEAGHPAYPEAALPKPEYMIVMKVEEVVDLTPHFLR
jgi:general stress protein 26